MVIKSRALLSHLISFGQQENYKEQFLFEGSESNYIGIVYLTCEQPNLQNKIAIANNNINKINCTNNNTGVEETFSHNKMLEINQVKRLEFYQKDNFAKTQQEDHSEYGLNISVIRNSSFLCLNLWTSFHGKEKGCESPQDCSCGTYAITDSLQPFQIINNRPMNI